MSAAGPVKFGAWFLVVANLIMAFGTIWVFMRMAPAIEVIIARNEVSLESCEDMLASLLRAADDDGRSRRMFDQALGRAKSNITEEEEPAALDRIGQQYQAAFNGDAGALGRTVDAIARLGDINRKAMRQADARAKQLGYAGAWGVVFMATVSFLLGMIFLHALERNLSEPIEEIDAAITAYMEGDTMRRCTLKNPSKSIRRVFANVNEVLDKKVT
ncbi:MAG: hypothetical protein ACK5PS_19490 [Desulfopila sp.]